MIALVTGANGFIGSHLVRRLLGSGWDVRAMVRRTSDLQLLEGANPVFVHADVTDPASVARAVDGVDVVFHVAGAIAALNPVEYDRINAGGTRNVVAACRAASSPPSRIILVSSIAAGGPSTPPEPRHEDDPPAPVSRYGKSKLRAEKIVGELRGDVEVVIVRPPIVFGSGDSATLDLFKAVKLGILANIVGKHRRYSFVHVRDLVRGMELCATRGGAVAETFYICGPEDATLLEFQRTIAAVMKRRTIAIPVPAAMVRAAGIGADLWQGVRKKPALFNSDKAADATQAAWAMNKDKARQKLGFVGELDIEQGVREAYEWYRLHGWL